MTHYQMGEPTLNFQQQSAEKTLERNTILMKNNGVNQWLGSEMHLETSFAAKQQQSEYLTPEDENNVKIVVLDIKNQIVPNLQKIISENTRPTNLNISNLS